MRIRDSIRKDTVRSVLAARTLAWIAGLLVAPGLAQEAAPREDRAPIRWRLDDDGRVQVWPEPTAGGDGGWRTLGEPAGGWFGAWPNLGVFGYAGVLLTGDGDLLATADADRFFERLNEDDAALLRRVTNPPAPDAPRQQRLLFRLAIHAAADRGLQAARGALEALLGEPAATDAPTRAAARAAIASLTGGAVRSDTRRGHAGPELASILASIPDSADAIAVVDQTRLPPGRVWFTLGRLWSLADAEATVARHGGWLQPESRAQAYTRAETASVLGYELTRRYGEHRVLRTVAAIRFPTVTARKTEGAFWVHVRFDGTFDVRALREGLTAEGLLRASDEAADDDRVDLQSGYLRLTVTPDHAVLILDSATEPRPPLSEAGRAALLADLRDIEAPIAIRLYDVPPSITEPVFGETAPELVCLDLPRRAGGSAAARLRFATQHAVESFIDRMREGLATCEVVAADDAIAASVREAADTIRRGVEFTAREDAPTCLEIASPLPSIDLEELAAFAVRWRR